MRNYSQLYAMPFYEGCTIFFNLFSGMALINEYKLYTGRQLTYIFTGCALSIVGILLKLLTLEAFDSGSSKEENFVEMAS